MNEKQKTVEIITIGDEILIGQIVDTNSAWMAVELNRAGFEIKQITSIHDDREQIVEAVHSALIHADIVLITGGIGPTKDDITKQTLCDYFGTKLVFSEEVYKNIERLFANRPHVMNDLTRAQAMVPESAVVIQNRLGTAPITWFEKNEKIVVSMPGVPYEMKETMSWDIIPRLKAHFSGSTVILHKTVLVYGYTESALAIKIADWENSLPENIHLAYLPSYGIIRVRLSGIADDMLALDFALNQQVDKLVGILGDAIIAKEDITVEKLIGDLLKKAGKTISTAESCTGGNIAHMITTVPGSSTYFKGSVVSYSNDVKINTLGVSPEDLEKEGAVSQAVVEQMTKGALRNIRSDISVATSGIAGPGGGTEEKPVGTVWIAVADKERIVSRKFFFPSQREQFIERATQAALLMVREIV